MARCPTCFANISIVAEEDEEDEEEEE